MKALSSTWVCVAVLMANAVASDRDAAVPLPGGFRTVKPASSKLSASAMQSSVMVTFEMEAKGRVLWRDSLTNADRLADEEEFFEAEQLYAKVLRMSSLPRRYRVLVDVALARLHMLAGKLDKAQEMLARAMGHGIDEMLSRVHYFYGLLYTLRGDLDAAIVSYEAALQHDRFHMSDALNQIASLSFVLDLEGEWEYHTEAFLKLRGHLPKPGILPTRTGYEQERAIDWWVQHIMNAFDINGAVSRMDRAIKEGAYKMVGEGYGPNGITDGYLHEVWSMATEGRMIDSGRLHYKLGTALQEMGLPKLSQQHFLIATSDKEGGVNPAGNVQQWHRHALRIRAAASLPIVDLSEKESRESRVSQRERLALLSGPSARATIKDCGKHFGVSHEYDHPRGSLGLSLRVISDQSLGMASDESDARAFSTAFENACIPRVRYVSETIIARKVQTMPSIIRLGVVS